MNPLTLVKRIQKINSKEADLGISEEASWHAKYKDSAYVFVGGIPYDLTEGDLLAVFAQCVSLSPAQHYFSSHRHHVVLNFSKYLHTRYGEIVDVNLVRDKATGKSKGFSFIAYEDQRSTNLAVDNLNGAQILGRIIRVDHVTDYRKKEEEEEEKERQKREARGVCHAFQRGECNRGGGCKFSHDEQRAANTGRGPEEDRTPSWRHDKFDDRLMSGKKSNDIPANRVTASRTREQRQVDNNASSFGGKGNTESHNKQSEINSRDQDGRHNNRLLELKGKMDNRGDHHRHSAEKRSSRHEPESDSAEEHDRKERKRARLHQADRRGNRDEREREKRPPHARISSSQHHSNREDDDYRRLR